MTMWRSCMWILHIRRTALPFNSLNLLLFPLSQFLNHMSLCLCNQGFFGYPLGPFATSAALSDFVSYFIFCLVFSDCLRCPSRFHVSRYIDNIVQSPL